MDTYEQIDKQMLDQLIDLLVSFFIQYHTKGNGNPLRYSCLGNAMDRGAWQATVDGVAKGQTQLSQQLNNNRPYSYVLPTVQWLFRKLNNIEQSRRN